MSVTLLRCPFCGANARHPHKNVRNREKFAACSRHGCILHSPLHGDGAIWYAVAVWNKRAAIVVTNEMVDASYNAYLVAEQARIGENFTAWCNPAAIRAALTAAIRASRGEGL